MFRKTKWIIAILAAIAISFFLNPSENTENGRRGSKESEAPKIEQTTEIDESDRQAESPSPAEWDTAPNSNNRILEKTERSELQTPDSKLSYKVVRVVDGDTVILQMDGKETRIRLIGVDTPETVHPKKAVQYYGKEASRFLKNLLSGEEVWVQYETGGLNKDKYDRTLAYLYRVPDRLFINAEIIRQGYGNAYTRYPFKYMKEFQAHEKSAREAKRGLWAEQQEKAERGKEKK